jgi:hypothetical protein
MLRDAVNELSDFGAKECKIGIGPKGFEFSTEGNLSVCNILLAKSQEIFVLLEAEEFVVFTYTKETLLQGMKGLEIADETW